MPPVRIICMRYLFNYGDVFRAIAAELDAVEEELPNASFAQLPPFLMHLDKLAAISCEVFVELKKDRAIVASNR